MSARGPVVRTDIRWNTTGPIRPTPLFFSEGYTMNALMIAVGLFALLAGLLLAGLILMRHRRSRDERRQANIESAKPRGVKAAPWPAGWKGIPESDPGDGTQ